MQRNQQLLQREQEQVLQIWKHLAVWEEHQKQAKLQEPKIVANSFQKSQPIKLRLTFLFGKKFLK